MKPIYFPLYVDSELKSVLQVSHKQEKTAEDFKKDWERAKGGGNSAEITTINLRQEGWEIASLPIHENNLIEAPKLWED
jgi:hypothetical protein